MNNNATQNPQGVRNEECDVNPMNYFPDMGQSNIHDLVPYVPKKKAP